MGASQVVEGKQTQFTAIATMSNNTTKTVTPVWTLNNSSHSIGVNGLFTAGLVNFDTVVTVSASYTENGTTVNATDVTILVKDDPEIWTPVSLTIVGPTSVDEGSTTAYVANVNETSSKGNTRVVSNAVVTWLVDNYGSVSTDGKFTASLVNSDAVATISAVFNDGISIPVTASQFVTVKNVPLLQSLTLTLNDSSVYGGYATKVKAVINKLTGSTDVTTSANISYTTSDPLVVIDKNTGNITTQVTTTDKSVTITGTYVEAGENKTATVVLVVKANVANSLTITPSASTIFEGQTVQFNASLTLVDGSTQAVTPIWAVDNTNYGNITIAGLFTAASVSANAVANISAVYSGVETGGVSKQSNNAVVNVTNIAPVSMVLYNDSAVYTVNEGSSVNLKARVTFNNGTTSYPTAVTYSLSTADQAYATISTDATTGVVTVTPKDLIADKQITVNAVYVNADAIGGQVLASKVIQLKYVRSVVGLQLSLATGPYFENSTYALSLKQVYDDGTYGAAITSGITWSDVSAFGTLSGNNLTFKSVTSDTPFAVSASYGGLTSNTVSGTVMNIAVVNMTISSSLGTTIKRDQTTTLTVSLILSDGSVTNPSPLQPVTWQLLDSTSGTLTQNADYTASFKAASLLTDAPARVTATSGGVTVTANLTVDGYPVPTTAVLSGPSSVNSSSVTDYTLTVAMSDGTNRVINASQSNYSAVFGHTFASGSITAYGRFTAGSFAVNTNGTITASYTDAVSGVTVTAAALPVVVNAALVLAPSSVSFVNPVASVASGSTTDFEIAVLMNDGTTRNISPTKTTYSATWTTTLSGASVSSGRLVAAGTNSDVSGTVTASYTLNGVTKTATTPVTVKAAIGTSLTLNPSPLSVFETKTQQITATLNTGVGAGVTVVPTSWSVANSLLGSVDANGLFTAASVSADASTTITAKYTGANTNNIELSATISSVTVKDNTVSSVVLYNDSASYSVNEGATITLKAKATFTDGSIVDAPTTMSYSITSGSAYASLSTASGIATITGGTVTANQSITVTGTYTAPDGKVMTATKTITVTNSVKLVTSVVVDTVQVAPYYENTNLVLRVRELYDDGSYGSNITSGVTWALTDSSLAVMTGVTAALATVTGDKAIGFTATYNGKTSAVFNTTITDVVPQSVSISSSTGSLTVKRGSSATLSATITLNNGTTVSPSATYPITWANSNASAGTFSLSGYQYVYNAANSDVDVAFTVTATTGNNKSATANLTLDGYPIPTAATITGSATVNAGATSDYTLTVNMSDGTLRTINASQSTYSATWGETLATGGAITAYGRFTAGSPAADESGNITASYTDSVSGVTVTAPALPITVKVVSASTFADAVYVGQVGRSLNLFPDGTSSGISLTATSAANIASLQGTSANKTLFETWLGKWLSATDPNNGSSKYFNKIANATKLFPAQTITLNRGATPAATYPADNYDAAFICWPQSRTASGALQSDAVNTFNSASLQSALTPTGSITLKVNGVDTVFDYYLYTVTLSANGSATIYFRCV
jgi:hypothetical protein